DVLEVGEVLAADIDTAVRRDGIAADSYRLRPGAWQAVERLVDRVGARRQRSKTVVAVGIGGRARRGAAAQVDLPTGQRCVVGGRSGNAIVVLELRTADGDVLEVGKVLAADIDTALGG